MSRIEEAFYNLVEDWGYTEMIDETTPKEIIDFLNSDSLNLNLVNSAVKVFENDLKKFPPSNSMDSLDIIYDEDHKRFYKKYIDFAKKCKNFSNYKGITGYGGLKDVEKIKIVDLCRFVDYNFPYGWK